MSFNVMGSEKYNSGDCRVPLETYHARKKRAFRSKATAEGIIVKKITYASYFAAKKKRARKSKAVDGTAVKMKDDDHGMINHNKQDFGFPVCTRSRDLIYGCGSVDEYETLNVISRGSYGIVCKVREKKTGEIVAMKEQIDGLSISSFREIDILKSLESHPSIVKFKNVVVDDYDGVYVVMEYFESDLHRYIDAAKDEKPFSQNEVKCLMKQLLDGVKFLHDNGVMHRDLKPSNILMSKDRNELKICDFGLSRRFGNSSELYSPRVATLWYRAPELLIGTKTYSSAIDMWSVGCIMAELLLKEPLFQGESEIGQLLKIYSILGTPCEDVWPGFSSLPRIGAAVKQPCNLLRSKFPADVLTRGGFDLLTKFLTYDPAKRITAEAALNHAWFKEI